MTAPMTYTSHVSCPSTTESAAAPGLPAASAAAPPAAASPYRAASGSKSLHSSLHVSSYWNLSSGGSASSCSVTESSDASKSRSGPRSTAATLSSRLLRKASTICATWFSSRLGASAVVAFRYGTLETRRDQSERR